MTQKQWQHGIKVKLILSVTVFKDCSADSIFHAETLIFIVSEVQIQQTILTRPKSLHLHSVK